MSSKPANYCHKGQTKVRQNSRSGAGGYRSRIAINSSSDFSESVDTFDLFDESVPLLLNPTGGRGPSPTVSVRGSQYTTTEEYEAQIAREVRKYRLKYIFCQSCPMFCRNCRDRFPSEKSVYLALFLCLFEKLAYYTVAGNILHPFLNSSVPQLSPAIKSLVFSISMDMLAHLLIPIFGWIADARVGRYHMFHFSMWFLWFSYGLITLLFSLDDGTSVTDWNCYLLPVWMIIVNIGSAGFQATAVPFGADQILNGASGQISSFFYWYYWLRNLGAIILYPSFTCYTTSGTNYNTQWHGVVFGLLATATMSTALILNSSLHRWFFIDREKRNPLWNIIKIYLATVEAKRPQIRSAFSFSNLPAPTRMDLTKAVHGGQFDSEEVENAKTVGRILLVLLSVSGALIAYRGMMNVVNTQMKGAKGSIFYNFNITFLEGCKFEANPTWFLNVVVILIAIPILNQFLVPFLREYRPNILQKIIIGYVLVIVASVSMLIIIGVGEHHNGGEFYKNYTSMCIFIEADPNTTVNHSNLMLLPVPAMTLIVPGILVSLAEVFICISCLEFCYAQSPHNMRGLMIGVFFFVWGFSDTVAMAILTFFSLKKVGPPESCNVWYHLIFLSIGVIMFIVFYLVSRWYRNRKRPISNENYVYYNLMNSKH